MAAGESPEGSGGSGPAAFGDAPVQSRSCGSPLAHTARSQGVSTRKVLPAVGDQQPCSQVFVLSGAAHADVELTSSLAEKISLLEEKIEKQAQEIQLKDRRIAELQEKIKTLQEGEDVSEPCTSGELEVRCLQLQRQVWEMEVRLLCLPRASPLLWGHCSPSLAFSKLPLWSSQPFSSEKEQAGCEQEKVLHTQTPVPPASFIPISRAAAPAALGGSSDFPPPFPCCHCPARAKQPQDKPAPPPPGTADPSRAPFPSFEALALLLQRFLSDYGLLWVGEARELLEDTESTRDGEELPAGSLCRPGEAVLCKQQIDFDLILENIKDLNSLVAEGVSQIEHTARGARLRWPEPLPVTLYRNGITVGHGAFRPYQHPATQQCLQDIMDGYFPSELQPRYPDGVPLQVTDRRDVVFQEPDLPGSFPGLGQVVGTSESSRVQETSKIPGKILNLPRKCCSFLRRRILKPCQGSAGALAALHSSDTHLLCLQGSDGQQSSREILVETPGLAALERYRYSPPPPALSGSPLPPVPSLQVYFPDSKPRPKSLSPLKELFAVMLNGEPLQETVGEALTRQPWFEMKKLKKAHNPPEGTFRLGEHSSSLGCGLVWVLRHGLTHLEDIPKHNSALLWSRRLCLLRGAPSWADRALWPRVKPAEQAGAPELCTLRVRSESGEQTYELRMLLTDTIGDLRQHLAHIRGGNSDYEIISTFPQRVYTDSSRSLQECGLVPRASLLLRRRDPPQQQGRGLQPA
ncbi:UBX domain-containing protein 11 [Pyrgilauda ruficollis]|uniref:UBX domain-containing protein 11 n=1 Tax=Pyrgilauda ruficollis TaxID=221976 RepID=UPI001B87DFCF|nr:UBX domain-containing protein 11 [Pyrgilauda ruficollis]